jgi:hypothetical protein
VYDLPRIARLEYPNLGQVCDGLDKDCRPHDQDQQRRVHVARSGVQDAEGNCAPEGRNFVAVDKDKDKEDNGLILSGVSAIVGIVPVVFVVDDNNDNEDDGIILLRMALLDPQKTRTLQLFFGLSDFSSVSLEDKETARQKM